jgi:two-component system response regulator DesR
MRTSSGLVRVLVADDNERVRAAVRDLLEAVGGFEVVGVASDGAEAVALADDLRPDVVLMDVAMPVLNGIEATRRITSANPAARVVILTALRGREREAREAGADAQLLKDTSPEELVRCLRLTTCAPRA